MNVTGSKVVIVGAGNVGATTAFSLTVQEVCSELVLVDQNNEKALGEVMDLQHSIEYLNRNIRISVGGYDACKDAHIVVITASGSMEGVTSRLDLLHKNIPIMDNVVDNIMASGFDGHIIVVSNPVDILSYYVYKRSGLPKAQVIGTGTSIETARLKQIIGDRMRVDPRSV
ncbi:MAG: L-lactate dehydrogenase, partial [Vallitaleaceae bacterium]|nr:L-lactate dehydrogenase [Vallitaleaceae bacterium]